MTPTFAYMIRRKADGLFSTGGMAPLFTKVGKMWRNLKTFHGHLALFRERYLSYSYRREYFGGPYENGVWVLPKQYEGCEVVKIRIVVDEAIDLQHYIETERPPADKLRLKG